MDLPMLLSIINPAEPAVGGRAFGEILAEDILGHRPRPHSDFATAALESAKPHIAKMLDDFTRKILPLLGFDEEAVKIYRAAANERVVAVACDAPTMH